MSTSGTITVYGAGAIGGTTGAALAAAGHDVLLVDDATRFRVAALVRERNRVLHALDRATELAKELSHAADRR